MKHTFRLPAAGLAILCLLLLLPVPARGASMDIRIGIKCKCPPYQFLDQEGSPTGLHIEMLRKESFGLDVKPHNACTRTVVALHYGIT